MRVSPRAPTEPSPSPLSRVRARVPAILTPPPAVPMTDRKDSNFGAAMLDGFAVDVSHQEIERIVVELEELYKSQPGEWLPITGIGAYLASELGYEDVDEFEDALKSDFKTFIGKLPHVRVSVVESELQPGTFREVFQVSSSSNATTHANAPRVMRLRVKTREDLWRVFMKSPNAELEIPEIDFRVGGDAKRAVDSVYNHVAAAVFNLETHVSHMASSATSRAEREGIEKTCESLRKMLDLEREFTLTVYDYEGASAFKPDDGVEVEPMPTS